MKLETKLETLVQHVRNEDIYFEIPEIKGPFRGPLLEEKEMLEFRKTTTKAGVSAKQIYNIDINYALVC